MGNKHISHRQSVMIYEFFIVFGYCGIEEILNTAYLPLWFALILQQWTIGPIDREIVPFSAEMDHPDKVTYI